MKFYNVGLLRNFGEARNILTYKSETTTGIGQMVEVQVGKMTVTGVVIEQVVEPTYDTKELIQLPYSTAREMVESALWLHNYYQVALPDCLKLLFPTYLFSIKKDSIKRTFPKPKQSNLSLSQNQQSTIDTIEASSGTHLLHGVTGSGKTEIYFHLIQKVLSKNQDALLLVPEIALSSQLVSRAKDFFGIETVLHYHSGLTATERKQLYADVHTKERQPVVVIGTRSSLFLPFSSLGIMCIDEAHDSSYFQQSAPKYHALKFAAILANKLRIKLVLGTATPSVNDYYLAKKQDAISHLSSSYHKNTKQIQVVDTSNRNNFARSMYLSEVAIKTIEKNLADNYQILVFINRRGTAASTTCNDCGHVVSCPNCDLALVFHADKFEHRCHVCNVIQPANTACEKCGSLELSRSGVGTKKIESELQKFFKTASILRVDRDNISSDEAQKLFSQLHQERPDILVGTQMLAKGFDLSELQAVIIVNADGSLSVPDYTASENTFQLLSQVVGRTGRNNKAQAATVVLQTQNPHDESIKYGTTQNYHKFYEHEINQRQKYNYPPFVHLLKITAVYSSPSACKNALLDFKQLISTVGGIQALGPAPAMRERVGKRYYWNLTLKSRQRAKLTDVIAQLPTNGKNWRYQLDPPNLL